HRRVDRAAGTGRGAVRADQRPEAGVRRSAGAGPRLAHRDAAPHRRPRAAGGQSDPPVEDAGPVPARPAAAGSAYPQRPEGAAGAGRGGDREAEQAQGNLTMRHNYIDGQWVEGRGLRPNINPSNIADVIDEYAQADAAQTQQAVAAARAAFPAWSCSNVQARAEALDRIGSELLARKEELGRLLSREEGKTLPEGIAEVARA